MHDPAAPMIRLVTFNVNSVRVRAPHVRRLLDRLQPDLAFRRETGASLRAG